MTHLEMLEERCNFAEARCQQLQDQLDEALDERDDALIKLEKISDLINYDPDKTPPDIW